VPIELKWRSEVEQKKIYVTSGQLAVVLIAEGPLDAIQKALAKAGQVTLDPDYFYLDERGFREGDNVQYKVPVEQALTEAGYVFEDDEEGGTPTLASSVEG
jgi:hypothetical protein